MVVGMIGCGKLGLPVALAIESRGHEVIGYDINPNVQTYLDERSIPFQEEGIQLYLDTTQMRMASSIGEVVANSDIVFCAIQTPHESRFEGTTRLPEDRADFNYTYLKQAITEVVDATEDKTTLAVISTCLPGTFNREIKPLLNDKIDYVYNPLYIAMGTVIMDYLNPEFVLIGQDSPEAAERLGDFYRTIHDKPHVITDITTAEGIKVSYNTWITAKTVIANAWGEMCERLGMNFDDMHEAWSLATDRLVSTRYTKAGMPDGGGCHPRDNIALSHIAKEIGMSHNLWEDLMAAREAQVDYFSEILIQHSDEQELPIVILGRSFKPETNIETGSGAILLANILRENGKNPHHCEDLYGIPQKAIYFIGTAHERYKDVKFPNGSTVIDPHGIINDRKGVTIKRIGRL